LGLKYETVKIRNNIPNFITCLNLFSGCLGITAAFQGDLPLASCFMALAAVFDFFDGMAARLLHAKSNIGMELDSLADVVSFGVLPGVIMIHLMKSAANLPGDATTFMNPFLYVAFLIPVFSAVRLAVFNLDTRQTDSFLGLPTPANGLLIASFPLIIAHTSHAFAKDLLSNYWVLAAITVVMCGLLVSEIPLFSLKVKNLKWKDNRVRFTFLILSLLVLVWLKFTAIPLIIALYIALSLVFRQQKTGENRLQG
jgi:CDP-diacylglycerol---serine O-phosphatidyltransferase